MATLLKVKLKYTIAEPSKFKEKVDSHTPHIEPKVFLHKQDVRILDGFSFRIAIELNCFFF